MSKKCSEKRNGVCEKRNCVPFLDVTLPGAKLEPGNE